MPPPRASAPFSGRVVGIVDGDTVTVLRSTSEGPRPVTIHLAGIDTPEDGQDFAETAKEELSELLFAKDVRVEVVVTEPSGEILGRVTRGWMDASRIMVHRGLAWHDREQSDDPTLAGLEQAAQQERIGLWSHAAIAPWDYRAGKRLPTATQLEAPPGSAAFDPDPEVLTREEEISRDIARRQECWRTWRPRVIELHDAAAHVANARTSTGLRKAALEYQTAYSPFRGETVGSCVPRGLGLEALRAQSASAELANDLGRADASPIPRARAVTLAWRSVLEQADDRTITEVAPER